MKLKLLYLIDSLVAGGAETSLAAMAPLLPAHCVELHVAYLREREGVGPQLVDAGVFLHPIVSAHGWFGRLAAVWRLVRDLKPDLVHTTLFESDIVGRLAARLAGVPVVSSFVNTAYDQAHFEEPAIRRHRLVLARALDRYTTRLCVSFHAISETVAQEMSRTLNVEQSKIVTVPRGRDLALFRPTTQDAMRQIRSELAIDDTSRLLLAVGRQEEQKGLDTAIRAMSPIRDAFPNTVLLIAGRPGGASERLRQLVASLELEHSVRFLGHRSDVARLMTAADIFVFPSRREGLGGALVEAMATGVPAVCSRLPVLREVATNGREDAALFFECGDHEALARAITQLLSDSRLSAQLANAGRQIAESRYELATTTNRMVHFWIAAASKDRSGRGSSRA